ncbi:MAG: amidohydrolase [Thermomicrobiales bacterium]|nr:amidohydrolase [Thermomicrobiales bacterium]
MDNAVLIQMFGQFDNREILEASQRYPGKFAPVVMVNAADPNATVDMQRLANAGARGVRLEASTRSAGSYPLAIWRRADELGLSVSCNGSTIDYLTPHFRSVLDELPALPIVIEHLGRDGGTPSGIEFEDTVFDELLKLASCPNLFLRFHGLGELLPRGARFDGASTPFIRAQRDRLVDAVSAFGPERMMWGSDYPPVSGREGYRNALDLPRNTLSFLGEEAIDLLFGGTASRFYHLS